MNEDNSLEKKESAINKKLKGMQDSPLLGRIKSLERAILIDGSSSMTDWLPGGTNRHEVVKKVYKEHLQSLEMRMFNFADYNDFKEILRQEGLPYPCGGTDMTHAFEKLKELGVKRVIIVTDGQPNDPNTALDAAKGLQFDIVYIGEPPIPDFLLKLGNIKGNSFQSVDMLKEGSFGELSGKIKGLLGTGK